MSKSPSTPDPTTPPAPTEIASALGRSVPLTGVALGIDVGGTGIKAAMVDLATAELVSPRIREKTPQPSTPEAVIEVISSVVSQVMAEYGETGNLAVGCGLPGAIQAGFMRTAANVDKAWVDYDATSGISSALGRPVRVINDADAAGMAELAFGVARDRAGTTILLTVGTGIGSALISDGRLVPNTELGHLNLRSKAAETLISGAARSRRGIGWKRWSREFNSYLARIEFYFWPDLIIIGGGVSKDSKKYWHYLETQAPLVKATFLNTSGIIGAAYSAGLAVHHASAGQPVDQRD